MGTVPAVDLGLQGVAHREQFTIPWREIPDDRGEPGPEGVGRYPRLGGRFLRNEVEQDGSDLQSVGIGTIHVGISL
jgi:hypothetical protein